MQKRLSRLRTQIFDGNAVKISSWVWQVTVIISVLPIFSHQLVRAEVTNQETIAKLQPSTASLELNLLANPSDRVVTANTISQSRITVPSLWWSKENYGNKLLDNWIAYPASTNQPGRIDLIVNQQVWVLLDYLERYNFINQLGTVARQSCSKELTNSVTGENMSCEQGYNLRVFNYQQEFLGAYTCDFDSHPNVRCGIEMRGGNRINLNQNQNQLTFNR